MSRQSIQSSAVREFVSSLALRQEKASEKAEGGGAEGGNAGGSSRAGSERHEEEDDYDDVDVNDIPWLQLFMVVTLVGVCGFFFVYLIRELLPT